MKPIFLILFLILQAQVLLSQEPVALPDKQGTWTYAYLNDENTKVYCQQFGMTAQEISVFKNKLDQMVALLQQNPVMADPRGFDAAVESRPLYPHGFSKHPENFSYIGEINFRLPLWFNSKGKIYKQTIEPPRVTVYANNIRILRHSAFKVTGPADDDIKKAADRVNDVCRAMKIKDLAPGVTLYDYAIVFTKPDRSLYLPCTVAEAYKRLIAYYELVVQKQPVFQVMLDGILKEYNTLDQSALNGPAYFGGMFSGITPVKNDDPLYLFNNDFFDRTLSKTAFQIIVFPVNANYFSKETDFGPNGVGPLRIHQFQHSLDLTAIAKLID